MKHLYLCGPISKDPEYQRKFAAAESELGTRYFVSNPARLGMPTDEGHWGAAMKRALRMMLETDGLALLDGWEDSRGACVETYLAAKLGMPTKTVRMWMTEGDDGSKPDTV